MKAEENRWWAARSAPAGLSRFRKVPWLLLLVTGISLAGMDVRAGAVSLDANEIIQLRNLVSKDDKAGASFVEIRKTADVALRMKPNPIAVIVSEGHLESDPEKIRAVNSLKDMNLMEALAWTWTVTGDVRYAGKAREYILAWARVNHSDGDSINESKFQPLIVSYDLVRPQFQDDERTLVDGWLRKKAETVWNDPRGLVGNWNSHRVKTVGLIGFVLQDASLINLARDGFRKQLDRGFTADGGCIDFEDRDALHYHLYSVEPLLALARAMDRRGDQWFTWQATNGVSLQKTVEFVIPFVVGDKTHVEFAHSKVAFDHQRATNGESEYAPHVWNPDSSAGMFTLAAWFDPKYGKLASKLAGAKGDPRRDWNMVINQVSNPAAVRNSTAKTIIKLRAGR